ncbi:hypothetical protein [Micromonospora citrea]|nr:hypothetical protein [Micromonospora citrea]
MESHQTYLVDETEHRFARLLEAIQEREGDMLAAIQRSEVGEELDRAGGLPQGKRLAQQDAQDYLRRYEAAVVNRMRVLLPDMSPGEWLWYLRRVPSSFTAGSVLSTSGYVGALAEMMSGTMGSHPSKVIGRHASGYALPVTTAAARRVAALVSFSRLIAYAHSMARWCGKGASIKWRPDGWPYTVDNREIRPFVELYDQRMSLDSGNLLSGLGTALPPLSRRQILGPRGTQMLMFGRTTQPDSLSLPHPENQHDVVIPRRYWPLGLPLDHILDLVENLDFSTGRRDDGLLGVNLLLTQTASDIFRSSDRAAFDILQRGYSIMSKETLLAELEETLAVMLTSVDAARLPFLLPPSGEQALQALLDWRGSSFPLFPSSPVRELADAVILDVVGASESLRRLLTYSSADGKIANVRGQHFERKLQELIDDTPAKPTGVARSLIRRKIKRAGNAFTDIDAVAYRDGTLLLVDAKSKRYDDNYETGSWQAVKNLRDALEKDAAKWQQQVTAMVDENLVDELSSYSAVKGVVCTPFVPYLMSADALDFVVDGLRAVVSGGELESWCRRGQ